MLIVVDQKSLNALPVPTMFWHRYYAPAIEAAAAAGAKVLGLDEAFGITVDKYVDGLGEEEMAHLDEKMAEAVVSTSSTMPVICAYIPTEMANQESQAVPMNMAAAALGQTAYVNLTADEDDFIRSIELTEPGAGQQPKAMALAVAERFLGHTPAYPSRLMLIRFSGPAGTVRRISLVDFLAAAEAKNMDLLRSWVGGKAVLLGPEMDTKDRHATPYYAFTVGPHANTAGVEIHANALNTLLTGRYLQKVPALRAVALMFVFAFLFSLTTIEATGWRLIAWHSFLTVVLFAGAHLSFRAGWLVPGLEPAALRAGGVPALAGNELPRRRPAPRRVSQGGESVRRQGGGRSSGIDRQGEPVGAPRACHHSVQRHPGVHRLQRGPGTGGRRRLAE